MIPNYLKKISHSDFPVWLPQKNYSIQIYSESFISLDCGKILGWTIYNYFLEIKHDHV